MWWSLGQFLPALLSARLGPHHEHDGHDGGEPGGSQGQSPQDVGEPVRSEVDPGAPTIAVIVAAPDHRKAWEFEMQGMQVTHLKEPHDPDAGACG